MLSWNGRAQAWQPEEVNKNSEVSIKPQSISYKCSSTVVMKITWPAANMKMIFMEKKDNRCIKVHTGLKQEKAPQH